MAGSTCARTCVAVVPEPRNTVSPGLIMAAVAWAMRCLSCACAHTFVTYRGSSTMCCLRMAPPWVRESRPSVFRRSRSRRMVISETPSRSLSAETRTLRCSASISRMRPCRSAGNISRLSGDDIELPRGCDVLSESLTIERVGAILRLEPVNVKCSGLCECVVVWENAAACSRRREGRRATGPPPFRGCCVDGGAAASVLRVGRLHLAPEGPVDVGRVQQRQREAAGGDDQHHLESCLL